MEDDNSINILELIEGDEVDSLFGGTRKISKVQGSKKVSSVESKTTKRKRKPKPPDMPRRPLSAYNIFFQEQRALIIGTKPPALDHKPKVTATSPTFERKKRAHRRTHGKISFSDLAKAIGKKWNELSKDGRAKYVESAAKEKARYQEELKVYKSKKHEHDVPDHCNDTKKKSLQRHRKQISNAPKRFRPDDMYPTPCKRSPSHVRCFQYHNETSSLQGGRSCDLASNLTLRCGTFQEESIMQESRDESLDDIQPLPISYDPNIHEGEYISNHEMARLVAPLLKSQNIHRPTRSSSRYYRRDSFTRHRYPSSMDSTTFQLPLSYAQQRTYSWDHEVHHDTRQVYNAHERNDIFQTMYPSEFSTSRSFDFSTTNLHDNLFSL